MAQRFQELAQFMGGWMGYFRLSEHDRSLPELDHWIRRRIRACYWKQWRNVRTKVRELMKLGTPLSRLGGFLPGVNPGNICRRWLILSSRTLLCC